MARSSLGQRDDFRDLVDHLEGVALWIVSEPGTFEYISAGFEEIWGIPPEEVQDDVGRLVESIHPDDRERVRSRIEQSPADRSAESYEARVVRPDGEVRWVQARLVPVRDGASDVTEVVGISTDITEQKRRERELEILNRVVRHDIRNDMAIVLGWAEMLDDYVDDAGREYLRKVIDSGQHVLELTESAHDMVEAVTRVADVETRPVSLRSVLESEVSRRESVYPSATFVTSVPDVDVAADAMLSSVFRNLLNNAVQHNDRDEPVVDVTCEVRQSDVVVRVADNGPGVPDDRKDAIFGKGDRGLDSPGTGLGLYLVNTLVDRYGGDVSVEDNDPGAVFSVRLPRA